MATDGPAPVKVRLHDGGQNSETVWALPVESPPGRRFVRLDNIPFLHAKPTYGDVVEVVDDPAQPGFPSWDAAGRSYGELCAGLVEDGGRYAVIVDYTCDDPDRFAALSAWAQRAGDLECEGSRGPRDGRPGRMYLAAPHALEPAAILALLAKNPLGFRFVLVHPR